MAVPKNKKITADEFFAITPEDDRQHVELFEGEIINFAAPTANHQRIVKKITREIDTHIEKKRGKCETFMSPFDVKLNEYNIVQPDVLVVCDPDKIDDKRCNGAPDLVIEVTSGNRKYDYVNKLYLYSESGVREYWIVDTAYNRISVHKFEDEYNSFIYTFEQDVPVGIFDDELSINVSKMI